MVANVFFVLDTLVIIVPIEAGPSSGSVILIGFPHHYRIKSVTIEPFSGASNEKSPGGI